MGYSSRNKNKSNTKKENYQKKSARVSSHFAVEFRSIQRLQKKLSKSKSKKKKKTERK
jgi:hypothetical protein